MKKLLIKNGLAVFPDSIKKADILISAGKIQKIGKTAEADETIDASGLYVLPGLVDLHYHGLFMFPDPGKVSKFLNRMREMLILRGVAGFIPTFPAAPIPLLCECLIALKEALSADHDVPAPSAEALGVHLEGPFLSKDAKGAQPESAICDYDPDSAAMAKLFEAGEGLIKIMTFAPERKGAKELLSVLKQKKIIPALGHSVASYELAEEFCDMGANYLTHLFSGMKPIHHRDPSLALAGLTDDRFFREAIVDGYHLHPAVVKLIWRSAPPGKFILITDLVGDEEPLDREPPRLPTGNLAGSRLRLIRAVRNLISFAGAPIPSAVAAASLWPAKVLGLDGFGEIRTGGRATLLLADQNLILKKIVQGDKVVTALDDA